MGQSGKSNCCYVMSHSAAGWDPFPALTELRSLVKGLGSWGQGLEQVSRLLCGRGWEWGVCRAQVQEPRGEACCWATRELVFSSLFSWQSLPGLVSQWSVGHLAHHHQLGEGPGFLHHPGEQRLWILVHVISLGSWRDWQFGWFPLSHPLW